MTDISIRTLLLEFVDANGASHIHEMHIEILRPGPIRRCDGRTISATAIASVYLSDWPA